MRNDWLSIALEDLAVLRVHGTDATRFLQGQLSHDLTKLGQARSLLAGFHNPQGRVLGLLRLVWIASDELLGVVPRELAASLAARLSKFVLRSKVRITDASADWRITGLLAPESAQDPLPGGIILPTHPNVQSAHGTTVIISVGNSRWMVLSPTTATADRFLEIPGGLGDRETWRRLDIEAGQPQVYAATAEEFVAQMLNLDVIDAISFDKGCYTGQEVIARAHYRGRVKRRLQRFVSRTPLELKPGNSGQLPDGRTFKVVDAVQLADGRCEFLAVAPMLADTADTGDAADTATPGAIAGSGKIVVDCEQLTLPYPLPA